MSYLLQYGELPTRAELRRWDDALRRHSALPVFVENAVNALPHDAHFMGIILTAINALSTGHPEQNPALAGQDIYSSKEVQDKQIVRLLGKFSLPFKQILIISWDVHAILDGRLVRSNESEQHLGEDMEGRCMEGQASIPHGDLECKSGG